MVAQPPATGDRLRTAARKRGVSVDDSANGGGDAGHDGGVEVSRIPPDHDQDTFAVEGLDTKRDERLLEAVLADHDGVSAASATHRNGTVRVHHAADVDRETLRAELASLGLVVAPGDDAFETRRAGQFANARVAVAVLFGLMVAVPYIGVLYPTRVEWLFYDPATVAYLQGLLASSVATHFYVNLAALSGVAFLIACGPTIGRARRALADRRLTREVGFVAGVVVVHAYSSLAAFTAFGGAVHYDLVAYAVVAVTLYGHFVASPSPMETGTVAGVAASAVDEEPAGTAGSGADDDAVALTDGGR
ncbi:hypothetical protein JCM17823_29450 [Halorubrum gandharaense]